MRLRPLFRLTLLLVGLGAIFSGLNLVARAHLDVAAAATASGAAAAGVAAWLLARDGRAGAPGDREEPGVGERVAGSSSPDPGPDGPG